MKTAIITGSSRGLGRETALRFARSGWNLVLNSSKSQESLTSTAREAESLGARTAAVVGDIASGSVRHQIMDAARTFGGLDCLINNAGVSDRERFVSLEEQEWDKVVGVNLLAPLALTRLALPHMNRGASIINIVSMCGLWGCKGAVAYSTAKAALAGSTAALAEEFLGRGIRVNAVAPGYMPTKMGLSAPVAVELAKSQHPMHRLADVAAAAEFIFQLESNTSINGQLIVLDGRIR